MVKQKQGTKDTTVKMKIVAWVVQLEHSNKGCSLEIEAQIIEMTANASGIRDISPVLKISTYKVMDTLKNLNLQ